MSNETKGPQPPAEAQAVAWPDGLLDRVKEAERRIENGHAPRRIPADPSDVDLVLAEVRALLEGCDPPFWIKPPRAPVGVERKYPDDGNGDDDAYNRGWNDCLDALSQQPPAVGAGADAMRRAAEELRRADALACKSHKIDRLKVIGRAADNNLSVILSALAHQPAPVAPTGAVPMTADDPRNPYSEPPIAQAWANGYNAVLAQQPAADPLDRIRQSPEYAREMARHDAQELAADFVEAKPVGYVSRDASQALMRVKLPEGTKLYTQQPADSGYQSAFYQTAAMLGIPAQPLPPREVWETQMRPQLLDLTSKQPAAVDEAMVERAALAFGEEHPEYWVCRDRMHAALTAALAAQQGGE